MSGFVRAGTEDPEGTWGTSARGGRAGRCLGRWKDWRESRSWMSWRGRSCSDWRCCKMTWQVYVMSHSCAGNCWTEVRRPATSVEMRAERAEERSSDMESGPPATAHTAKPCQTPRLRSPIVLAPAPDEHNSAHRASRERTMGRSGSTVGTRDRGALERVATMSATMSRDAKRAHVPLGV